MLHIFKFLKWYHSFWHFLLFFAFVLLNSFFKIYPNPDTGWCICKHERAMILEEILILYRNTRIFFYIGRHVLLILLLILNERNCQSLTKWISAHIWKNFLKEDILPHLPIIWWLISVYICASFLIFLNWNCVCIAACDLLVPSYYVKLSGRLVLYYKKTKMQNAIL